MLFEPYTRPGMLQRLDANFGAVCGSPADLPFTPTRNRIGLAWIFALGAWMLLIPTSRSSAQSSGTASTANGSQSAKTSTERPPVHHAVHHHHHVKPAADVAPAPVAPPPPLPPAEQPPNPATIDYKDGLLSVRAQNSSLVNILVQIQHQTGLVIDGLNHDQRVYGQYGPGSVSATLSALLDGAGYDFVIVGGGDSHTAARLILSTPGSTAAAAAPPPAVTNTDEAAPAEGDDAQPQDPTTPPQAKSPQEIFNEMRRRPPQ